MGRQSVAEPNVLLGEQTKNICAAGGGLAKRWSPGCVNAVCKARQEWSARAGAKFTQPLTHILADPCTAAVPQIGVFPVMTTTPIV